MTAKNSKHKSNIHCCDQHNPMHDHEHHCCDQHDPTHDHEHRCCDQHDPMHDHEHHCCDQHDPMHDHEHRCCGQHDPTHNQQTLVSSSTTYFPAKCTVYIMENLGCAHCASKMEEKINEIPGVSATITFATKQLRIQAKHPEKYLAQIQEICTSIESEVHLVKRETFSENTEQEQKKNDFLSIMIGIILFITGLFTEHLFSSIWIPILIYVFGYLILGGKILVQAGRNIIHGQIFDENFLMCIATLGAFSIAEYPEAIGIMLFYRIGDLFEEIAVEKSRSQIMDAVDMRPETVCLISGETIPAQNAKPGDLLLIRPGDRIPLDGTILEGKSRLDTSPITGEPVPVSVSPGSSVISGSINISGQLKLQVEKNLSESMVSRILDSVENAAANKPQIDRFITKFAKIYTPVVVLAAAMIAVIPSIYTGQWHYWIYTALTFLVMSCPCALVLSVPLAFFSGIGAGSKEGILFKGGSSMEALSQVKTVVMDKTGTITEGNFVLQNVTTRNNISSEEVLRLAAGCEQFSTHPIANSILSAVKERDLIIPSVEEMSEIAGHGISAVIEGKNILCGNRKLMSDHAISLTELHSTSYSTEVYLALDGICLGVFHISDTIKANTTEAITKLKTMNLHTVLLTGDSQNTALSVAKKTGIEDVYAKLLPQDKLRILQKVRKEYGRTLFVGDGINDAPVLAGADVGAAMGSGADAAIEAADVVYIQSDVSAIPKSICIAKKSRHIAWQNVIFALTIKLLVMLLGLFGYANMWMAVFADTGVAMLCVLNSIRVLYAKFH